MDWNRHTLRKRWAELRHWLNQDVDLVDLWRALRRLDLIEEVRSYLRTHPALQAVLYWVAATVTGLVAVLYAEVFHQLSELSKELARTQTYLFLGMAPLAFALSWWLVQKFCPPASGSGIPQVMAAIEMESEYAERQVTRLVGLKIIAVKVLSSLGCVLGGGAVGREGPTIQISASIFYVIGNRFRRIWPQISHQGLLIAGGAAGIAAAFNTPLGGIVFAIEELSHQHFNRFKTFLISAVIVAGMVAQWMLGPYLFFGYPKLQPVTFSFMPWAILLGVIAGLGGGAFGRTLHHLTEKLGGISMRGRLAYVIFVGVTLALCGAYLNTGLMGSGVELIREILFEVESEPGWDLVFGRFLGPLLTFSTGVAGGIFAPSLAAGAMIGAKLGALTQSTHPNLMVLLGMAGFLSGVTRAPFTTFVLVLEMTDRHSAIFALMVTSLVATIAARVVDQHSFYVRRRDDFLKRYASAESQ